MLNFAFENACARMVSDAAAISFVRDADDIRVVRQAIGPDGPRLIAKIEIRDVSSSFAMEQIKYTTEMPLDYMVLDKESGANAA
jgi:pyruvate kinase